MTTPGPDRILTTKSALTDALAALKDEILGGVGPAFDTLAELKDAYESADQSLTTLIGGKVDKTDPRLTDARTPVAHTHTVGDITATGTAGSATYLRGDGSWATPTNTQYAVMTQAEAEAGTASTARTMSSARLKGAIQRWVTGSWGTAVSAIGQALNRAATEAEARSAIGAVASDDVRLTDSRTPTAHTHPVSDLTTTGTASSSTYLRGDGTWATPTNTTYSAMSEAEATAGTATTARTLSAARLKGAIQHWATGSATTAISAIGQALNKAATAAEARAAIGAGTSNLVIGTTASTAKAGNYVPAWSEVSGKPATFTPASHSHAWGEITGKPTTFTPTAHTHQVGDVSGLQGALDGKVANAGGASGLWIGPEADLPTTGTAGVLYVTTG